MQIGKKFVTLMPYFLLQKQKVSLHFKEVFFNQNYSFPHAYFLFLLNTVQYTRNSATVLISVTYTVHTPFLQQF